MPATSLARVLIVSGAILVVLGLVVMYVGRIPGLGRLPGDIVVRRGNVTFYAPLASMLIVSLLLSLLFRLFGR